MLKPLPKSTLVIREMEPPDIDAVSHLAARIWRQHYPDIISPEQIDYMLEKNCSAAAIARQVKEKKGRFFVLYDGSDLSGYAALEPKPDGIWYLDKLYVDVCEHRKGLGSFLLHHAKRELAPKGLTLRVNRKNIKAINFYFKHGFWIEGLDVLDIGDGYVMDDFLMRWPHD